MVLSRAAKYDDLLTRFDFNLNLRRYAKALAAQEMRGVWDLAALESSRETRRDTATAATAATNARQRALEQEALDMQATVTTTLSPEAKADVRDSSSSFPQGGSGGKVAGEGDFTFDDAGRGQLCSDDKGTQVLDDSLIIFDEAAVRHTVAPPELFRRPVRGLSKRVGSGRCCSLLS